VAKITNLNIQNFEVLDSVKFLSGDFHDLGGVVFAFFTRTFYLSYA
jgi:hypothetical protein